MRPKARSEKITVEELHGEVLIYDHLRHKAHCLNGTAAFIWKHCDGKTSLRGLADLLVRELHIPDPLPVARLALEQLSGRHLLEAEVAPLRGAARLTRRDALRKMVVAAVTLPLIMTITAPRAQAAGSGCIRNGDNAPCLGGICCGGNCVNITSDPKNCGGCGNVCKGATPQCVMGKCSPQSCLGRSNNTACSGGFCCNGACVASSNTNCGTCGNTCGGGTTCCTGACKNLMTDSTNCGACGTVCPGGFTCIGGVCL